MDSWLQVMGEVGLLAKRASMIANTDERLGMLSRWYDRVKSIWPKCYNSLCVFLIFEFAPLEFSKILKFSPPRILSLKPNPHHQWRLP